MDKSLIIIADFLEEYQTELAAREDLFELDPIYRRGVLDGFEIIITLLRAGGEYNESK
jgi:hypothetical protein